MWRKLGKDAREDVIAQHCRHCAKHNGTAQKSIPCVVNGGSPRNDCVPCTVVVHMELFVGSLAISIGKAPFDFLSFTRLVRTATWPQLGSFIGVAAIQARRVLACRKSSRSRSFPMRPTPNLKAMERSWLVGTLGGFRV